MREQFVSPLPPSPWSCWSLPLRLQTYTAIDGQSALTRPDGATVITDPCVLGIDPSLSCTGYAVINPRGLAIVEAGVIRTESKLALSQRITELHEGIVGLLNEHAIGLVAVEDLYAHYKHPRTAILMGHARGVVLLAAGQMHIVVKTLAATRVKRALTGNGHASKQQMQRAIASTFGLSSLPEPNDVADAMAIALCAIRERIPNVHSTQ